MVSYTGDISQDHHALQQGELVHLRNIVDYLVDSWVSISMSWHVSNYSHAIRVSCVVCSVITTF